MKKIVRRIKKSHGLTRTDTEKNEEEEKPQNFTDGHRQEYEDINK